MDFLVFAQEVEALKLAVVGMENKGADEAVAGTENNGSGGVL